MNKENPFQIPIKSSGFLDYESVFKVIYGTLNKPMGILDDLTVQEVSWFIEQSEVDQKDYYEMMSYSIKTAIISVMNGKDVKMFEQEKEKTQKITETERKQELDVLRNKFNEDF